MKKIILNSILIFLLCSLFHFMYNFFPCFLTGLFFPVNESIFEHLKMINSAVIVFSLISNLFYKEENLFFRTYLRSMSEIIILLIIYLPCYYLFGEVMILTLIILFIAILLGEIIVSKISKERHYLYINTVSAIIIIINIIMFSYFTYNPPMMELFKDPKDKIYGIKSK